MCIRDRLLRGAIVPAAALDHQTVALLGHHVVSPQCNHSVAPVAAPGPQTIAPQSSLLVEPVAFSSHQIMSPQHSHLVEAAAFPSHHIMSPQHSYLFAPVAQQNIVTLVGPGAGDSAAASGVGRSTAGPGADVNPSASSKAWRLDWPA